MQELRRGEGATLCFLKDPFRVFSKHCFKSHFIRSCSQHGVFFPPSALSALLSLTVVSASPFAQASPPTSASLPFPASVIPISSPLPYSLTAGVGTGWLHGRVYTVLIDMCMYVHICVRVWVYVQVYMCVHLCVVCTCIHVFMCPCVHSSVFKC